jgi:hypothetical protein
MSTHQTEHDLSLTQIDKQLGPLRQELPAALTVLRLAALLPPDTVPWPWLSEVTTALHPELAASPAAWEKLRQRLEGLGLLTGGPRPEVACIDRLVAAHVIESLTEQEAGEYIRLIRGVVSRRLQHFTSERQRLFDEVRRGNAGPDAAKWYVAPLEEVLARAEASGAVKVTVLGDGSFVLGLKEEVIWEEPCFQAFISQQFAAESLDAIEWALRTEEVPDREIAQAGERIRTLHERRPEGVQEGKIMGLYLLSAARMHCRNGSDRSAYGTAGRAVELFERLHALAPADAEVEELLKKAREAQWIYDW